MKKSVYTVAQWLLYQTNRLIIENARRRLVELQGFSASYTDAFLDDLERENNDAEALPSEAQRAQEHKQILEETYPIYRDCQQKMMYLKRYIQRAFAKEFWDMNELSAGLGMYTTEMNYAEAKNMYSQALGFITINKTVLLANSNMPATFEAGFTAQVDGFKAKVTAFEVAENVALEGTDSKIDANNGIYAKIQQICADGQVVFGNDDTLKGEFSYEKQSSLIRPTGPAGLKGVVTKDGQPQAGLVVELENGDLSVITDAEGAFDFGNRLSSGTDTIVVKRGDEILAEEEVEIPPGVTKREDVKIPATPPVV